MVQNVADGKLEEEGKRTKRMKRKSVKIGTRRKYIQIVKIRWQK